MKVLYAADYSRYRIRGNMWIWKYHMYVEDSEIFFDDPRKPNISHGIFSMSCEYW